MLAAGAHLPVGQNACFSHLPFTPPSAPNFVEFPNKNAVLLSETVYAFTFLHKKNVRQQLFDPIVCDAI
jgi:hypothetical protein